MFVYEAKQFAHDEGHIYLKRIIYQSDIMIWCKALAMPRVSLYATWKHRKPGFLMFSGGEKEASDIMWVKSDCK